MRIVIKAVQICIITAFSLVPMNDFICSNCLMSRKKISTCHLLLYNSPMVLGDQLNWFVISSMTCLFSSSQTDTRLNLFGYLLLDDSFFKQMISSFNMCWCLFSGRSFSFSVSNCRFSLCLITKNTPLLSQTFRLEVENHCKTCPLQ